jgi:putative phosphotransacetylase
MSQIDREKIVDKITELVLKDLESERAKAELGRRSVVIPVGISNRHLHISKPDLEVLFGKGYELRVRSQLSQPDEFASYESVTLVASKMRALENVRILGPPRELTQVEIALTDGYYLGIDPPVRLSGDLAGTPGITVVGPRGTLILEEGVIRANRHVHITKEKAEELGLKNKQLAAVVTRKTAKPLVFHDVMIRVAEKAFFELHLDTDDGNAAGLQTGDLVELVI